MSPQPSLPQKRLPEIGQVLSPLMAQQAGLMPVVVGIKPAYDFHCYLYATELRSIWIITENGNVAALVDNKRFVLAIYSLKRRA